MEYRWCIFLANLDPVVGSEQGKTRPVLVISEEEINQLLPVVSVLPITSRKHKRRVTKEIGKIDDLELQEAIMDALCFQLGINR